MENLKFAARRGEEKKNVEPAAGPKDKVQEEKKEEVSWLHFVEGHLYARFVADAHRGFALPMRVGDYGEGVHFSFISSSFRI